MISFYPGPSRVYPKVPQYCQEAYKKGILSMNHRSEEFMALSKKTITLLKERLSIPKSYSVYFLSSATECWEVIAQSLITKESVHIFNGAFGKKWFDYTKRIRPHAKPFPFNREIQLNPDELIFTTGELICLTQNETSNGTHVNNKIIQSIKKNNSNHLIAIDATSSMGGISLDFNSADIWFASVQKCFGLPAGLGIMICSPEAIRQVRIKDKNFHYNSMLFLDKMMLKWQTPYTPNVLAIYLLMRVLESIKPIKGIEKATADRFKKWEDFFDNKSNLLNMLIQNKSVRSHTVIAIVTDPLLVQKVKSRAKKAGFLLGEGYGDLKDSTFRIANFPAIQRKEIAQLMDFMYNFI